MIELESSLDEDSYGKQALWVIADEMRRVKKKDGVDCPFCSSRIVVNTIRDFVKIYSSIVYCVVNHCDEDINVKSREMFEAELFILNLMVDPENLSVYKSLKGGYKKYENIRRTLGILSEEYFSNNVSVLECEHDVESLILMVYKKSKKLFKDVDIEYLLTILYIRKEYTRFFRIYGTITPSLYEYRLALSLTFNEDCDFKASSIQGKAQDIKMHESYTGLKGSENDELLQDIIEIVKLSQLNSEEWLKEAKKNKEWAEKVQIWNRNRNDGCGRVDRSMLDEAIRNKRWDEGWYIYKLGNKGVKEDYHKSFILCLRALNNDKDELWVSRLLDVIEDVVVSKQVEICCEIIEDLFDHIDTVEEPFRLTIVQEFIRKVSRMEEDERIVSQIIRVISRLCKTCNGTVACVLCVEHVNDIYKEWKKNNTGGFFFKHHSKYESEIFGNMLDLYSTLDDSCKFVGVCKDLFKNETKINKEMCRRIRSVHNKTYGNCCEYTDTRSMKLSEADELLSHLITHDSSYDE